MLQTELTSSSNILPLFGRPGVSAGFSVVDSDPRMQHRLEERIRVTYKQHFGACINNFMTRFAFYEHGNGATGVIGMRRATEETLFLERYLAQPIDEVIRTVTGLPVSRAAIAEVGQFAVEDRRIAADFFRDLVPFLVKQEFAWVCFTGTAKVRAILQRIGFHGLAVAIGDANAVKDGGDDWGTYYESSPLVIVGKLADPAGHWCGSGTLPQTAGARET